MPTYYLERPDDVVGEQVQAENEEEARLKASQLVNKEAVAFVMRRWQQRPAPGYPVYMHMVQQRPDPATNWPSEDYCSVKCSEEDNAVRTAAAKLRREAQERCRRQREAAT